MPVECTGLFSSTFDPAERWTATPVAAVVGIMTAKNAIAAVEEAPLGVLNVTAQESSTIESIR